MQQYYECHITVIEDKPRTLIQQLIEDSKWKFSAIDGDPVLGKKVYCYATKHYKEALGSEYVVNDLLAVEKSYKDQGLNVSRSKVELVVFDTKQNSYKE
jgi:hypothetical protein